MKKAIPDLERLRKHAPALQGVFTLPDIANLMAERHRNVLHRRIGALEDARVLNRFARGLYTLDGFSTRALSQKLRPDSYVSFGNVLADTRLIGSVPAFQIDAVALGRSRTFSANGITVRYFGIRRSLYFGFEVEKGIAVASPEKALLDTLYFHQHGAHFFFDLFSDVNAAGLNRRKLEGFIARYRNPKFKTFVRDYLNEHGLGKRR